MLRFLNKQHQNLSGWAHKVHEFMLPSGAAILPMKAQHVKVLPFCGTAFQQVPPLLQQEKRKDRGSLHQQVNSLAPKQPMSPQSHSFVLN